MPDPRPADEMEITVPASPATPVWAPNPGVPIVARMLAYCFGALVLLTIIATVLSTPAPDVPKYPARWSTLHLSAKCAVPYPEGWYTFDLQPAADSGIDAAQSIALLPNNKYPVQEYPVRVEALLVEVPAGRKRNDMVQALNDYVLKMLRQRLKTFEMAGDGGASDADADIAFTFTQDKQPMRGEWMIYLHGDAALILVAFASPEGWMATQVILHEMGTGVKWTGG